MPATDNIVLKRILSATAVSATPVEKALAFYRTVLELERRKEPEISNYYAYPLNFKEGDPSVLLVDLPCNPAFQRAFCDNRNVTFQKDLYVGFAVRIPSQAQTLAIFGTTIDHTDLRGYDPEKFLLPVRIGSFSVDAHCADVFEFDAATIESIDAEISKARNIDDIQALIPKYFGEDAVPVMELQLALSSKNIALSQITSELKKLTGQTVGANDLLAAFLTHSEFDNEIAKVSVDELLPVTPLDPGQQNVVAHALGNRFTVVTGAPGTGKTQVILNIIANALMKDKSVLVASKNNKAVDNVKERFDLIDPGRYLIRFGRKDWLRTQTLEAITHIQQQLDALRTTPSKAPSLLKEYAALVRDIREAHGKIARIDLLNEQIPATQKKISDLTASLALEEKRHEQELGRIRSTGGELQTVEVLKSAQCEVCLRGLRVARNRLQRRYSGFWKFWYNLFACKRDAEAFLKSVEELPIELTPLMRKLSLEDAVSDFHSGSDIIVASNKVINLLGDVRDYLGEFEAENSKYSADVKSIKDSIVLGNRQLASDTKELQALRPHRNAYESAYRSSRAKLVSLAPQILAAKIEQIERKNGANTDIAQYRAYLPDNVPSQDSRVAPFVQATRAFLDTCRLVGLTSLSVKSSFPLASGLFDLLIIDEASQCDVASAIPLILRAKQVVVIGDPMQLRHITSIRDDEEKLIHEHLCLSEQPYLKYARQSLWDYSSEFLALARQNSASVTLWNHYRCHHDIIGYSNDMFYGRFLSKPLAVRTDETKMVLPRKGVVLVDVKGKQDADRVNINRQEAQKVLEIVEQLVASGADISIGVVTPFRDQADHIRSKLSSELKERVEVNTAHGFQGDEKDVMIYSLVVTDNSPSSKIRWIDHCVPNLVNVAVTRARQTLYVVGNKSYIQGASSERDALGYLMEYASKH